MKCKEAIEYSERIKQLSSNFEDAPAVVNTPEGRAFIQRAYLMIMGKTLRGNCTNCHMDAFIELAIFIKNPNFKNIMESEYQFKNSMVFELVDNGTSITVTNHNITNDLAEKILIVCPEVADNMNKPEDWEERIKARIEPTAEATEEPKIPKVKTPKVKAKE